MSNRVLVRLTPWLLLSALALPGACHAPDELLTAPDSDTQQTPWTVTLIVSGGFAGVHRAITADQTGVVKYEDRKTGTVSNEAMGAADLRTLGALINNLPDRPDDVRSRSNCYDCYHYQLDYARDGVAGSYRLSDVDLSDSDVRELVAFLRTRLFEARIAE